jgi:hypothetical protein
VNTASISTVIVPSGTPEGVARFVTILRLPPRVPAAT